jgi:serine/threonine protein kinase
VLTLLNDTAQGIAYLHSKNIIHGGRLSGCAPPTPPHPHPPTHPHKHPQQPVGRLADWWRSRSTPVVVLLPCSTGDLKPENVLLKMDSTSPIGVVAKITDFGEAWELMAKSICTLRARSVPTCRGCVVYIVVVKHQQNVVVVTFTCTPAHLQVTQAACWPSSELSTTHAAPSVPHSVPPSFLCTPQA